MAAPESAPWAGGDLGAIPNIDYFLDNPMVDLNILHDAGVNPFSEAKALKMTPGSNRVDQLFVGNFFPDMAAWDKLVPHPTRGAGGTTLRFRSRTGKSGHMSVFPPRRHKLAHRHGPGRVIVIPAGEGYTIVWPPHGEKEIIPWWEGTVFTPQFEEELAKRGLTSDIPEDAYRIRDYEWDYGDDDQV